MEQADLIRALANLITLVDEREAALDKLNPDTDSYAEITEYDETRADHNERIVEAAQEVAAIIRHHGKV